MNTKYGKNNFPLIKNNSKIIPVTLHIYWLHSGAWKAANITKFTVPVYSVNWYLIPPPLLVSLSAPTISYQSGCSLIAQCSVPDEPRSRGAGYFHGCFHGSGDTNHKQSQSRIHKQRLPSSHRGSNSRTTCVHLPSSQETETTLWFSNAAAFVYPWPVTCYSYASFTCTYTLLVKVFSTALLTAWKKN